VLKVFRRDARTLILDLHSNAVRISLAGCGDPKNLSPILKGLACIGDQINDDLLQLLGIPPDPGKVLSILT
jgi:hypothetical protein